MDNAGRGSARPICALSNRISARGRRPHGALQLAICAAPRRHARAAHRGHRRRAILGRHGHRHPRRPPVARARLGRRPRKGRAARAIFPVRAARPISRRGGGARRAGACLLLLLRGGAAAEGARAGRATRRGVAVRPRVPRPAARTHRRDGSDPRGAGNSVQSAHDPHRVRGRGARANRVRRRQRRGLRHPALGRPPDVPPVRGRRRHRHGDHACDSRRRPHLQHPEAPAAVRGARRAGTAVRPRAVDPGRRQEAAEQAARRDLRHRVPPAGGTCRWRR